MMIRKLKPAILFLLMFTFYPDSLLATEKAKMKTEAVLQQEITDEQLRKFASAIFSLRQIDENARTKMGEVIQEQGMELQRFNEIYQAKQDPAAELNLSKEVEQQYEKIINRLEALQRDYLEKKKNAITTAGLTLQTFETIANRVQADPEFRERVAVIIEEIDLE